MGQTLQCSPFFDVSALLYGADFEVISESLIARLVGEGIPEDDLRVMSKNGFMYCKTRHSFLRWEGGIV